MIRTKILSNILACGVVVLMWLLALPVEAQKIGDSSGPTLQNPLSANLNTLPLAIEAFLRAVLQVALPIIAVAIVISGFMFVFARGNPDKLKTARRNFVYVIGGATLMLSGWVLATLILGTISSLLR